MAADLKLSALQEEYDKNIRPKIDLIDELRMDGLNADISLPQIVVIGDQSSGKSSTLEALSGVQLPRGASLTTRVPLAMVLRKSLGRENLSHSCKLTYMKARTREQTTVEIDEFDMENLDEKIRKAQDEVRGNGPFADSPIQLRLVTPSTPDLSLLDLPGIARMIKGEENSKFDIAEWTKNLIKKYVSQQETIILVVLPCNVDVANCEALRLAREVDPKGERTLGVLTKADLVNPGSEGDIMNIVNNKEWRLSKGYTIIRCRSQKEIDKNLTLEDAMKKEQRFFENHPVFRSIRKEHVGVKSLSKKLSRELAVHIKNRLPAIKTRIFDALNATRMSLDNLGHCIPADPSGKNLFLNSKCQKFVESINDVCSGDKVIKLKDGTQLNLQKQLRLEFHKYFENLWAKRPIPTEQTLNNIGIMMKNQRGRELPGFARYVGCEEYIQFLIEECRPFANYLLKTADRMVDGVISDIAQEHFESFPDIQRIVVEKLVDLRQNARNSASDSIEAIFQMENLIYTEDQFYHWEKYTFSARREYEKDQKAKQKNKAAHTGSGQGRSIRQSQPVLSFGSLDNDATMSVSEEGEFDVDDYKQHTSVQDAKTMLQSIRLYFNIAVRRISDTVPMAILLHMVRKLSQDIQEHILALTSDSKNLEYLLEDESTRQQRAELVEKLNRLQRAVARISVV